MKKIILFFVAIIVLGTIVPACGQLDRSKPPKAGKAPNIKIGDYKKIELKNGLKVIVVENDKLPLVNVSLIWNNDPVLEKEFAGVSDITAELLRSGTSKRTKYQIDEEIDYIGASLHTGNSGIYASSLKKHLNKTMDLMADVILNPIFPKEEVEKVKKQTVSGLAASKTNGNAIASNVGSALRYGKNHPYGEVVTEKTVAKVTNELCKKHHNTYYKPNVAYLVFSGDISLKEAEKITKKYFGKWKKGKVPTHKYEMPKQPKGNRVAVVNKVGAVQSVIRVTYPVDLKRTSKDVIKARVMNDILGGGVFSGRLMQNLREDKAYTYGVGSSLNPSQLVGSFNVSVSVKNAVTDSAVVEILNEMKRMIDEKVDEEHLQMIKNVNTGTFALSLESPRTLARFAVNIDRYNLPKDYYKNYLKEIEKVTIKDVQEMAKKYIKPNNSIILVVGNRDEVSKKMSKFSRSSKVEYFDIYGNSVVEGEKKPVPAGLTADKVISNYIKAVGGVANINKIKDQEIKMTTEMQGMTLEIVQQRKLPKKYASITKMKDQIMQKQVFDGKKAKSSGMMGEKKLTGDQLKAVAEEAKIFIEKDYKKLGYKLDLKSIETVKGKDAYRVDIVTPTGGKQIEYYDTKTGLKIRVIETVKTPKGDMTSTADMSDYKTVKGVKYPYTINQSAGGQEMKLEVKEIKINSNLKDDLFNVK